VVSKLTSAFQAGDVIEAWCWPNDGVYHCTQSFHGAQAMCKALLTILYAPPMTHIDRWHRFDTIEGKAFFWSNSLYKVIT
jgi:hypothetical protein